jgi:hypothetical protein
MIELYRDFSIITIKNGSMSDTLLEEDIYMLRFFKN